MKKVYLLIISIFLLQVCNARQNQSKTNPPKIENYNKGELVIKVAPFCLNGNEITVGKVDKNGTIHFNWPETNLSTIKDSDFYMESIDRAVGMSFCNDKQIEDIVESAKVVKVEELSLFKKGRYFGSLYPATDNKIQDNASLNRHSSLVLGSSLYWYFSDSDGLFKAKCSVNLESENTYSFKEVTSYDIQLKKGWNLVKHSLVEKEDWKNETGQGSLPKTITKTSIVNIPVNINWYVKYVGK